MHAPLERYANCPFGGGLFLAVPREHYEAFSTPELA
jgi:hypothetical protein